MEATAPPPPDQAASKLIAPVWHTVVTLFILAVLSALGALSAYLYHAAAPGMAAGSRITGYALTIVVEWLVLAFVWLGIRLRGFHLKDLMGGNWIRWNWVLRDLAIAMVFLVASNVVLAILGRLLHAAPNQAIRSLLPQPGLETGVYLLLALSAAICEEIIFRGYFQRQFAAMTRSLEVGLVIQGVIFGISHGYQGPKYMLIIAVYGCLFGVLAGWRSSLRPGMLAHFFQDGGIGLLARHLTK
jgi:uncharacterized protein